MVNTETVVEDIRQSRRYGAFIKRIGWGVERIDKSQAFIKPFPLVGSVVKIQRPNHIPQASSVQRLKQKHRAFLLTIEPNYPVEDAAVRQLRRAHQNYLPTKTIHISLRQKQTEIFRSFSESTRRAVRKACKNKVVVQNASDIAAFIDLKNAHFFPFGPLFTREITPLWETFQPHHAALLLAYEHDHNTMIQPQHRTATAGVLLLFHQTTCYYWLAASSKKGNRLRAPSLLVWEALRVAKKKNCTIFDFEGIWDGRVANRNKHWHGFSRFKRGFGGTAVNYPLPVTI